MQLSRRAIAVLCLTLCSSTTAIGGEIVTTVDTFGDWSLLTDAKTPHLFCFVTSEPKVERTARAHRANAPRAYISAWPKDGIKGEVSFRMGFRINKGTEGTATVSPGGYKLFGSNDRAYVANSTQELKLARGHAERQCADRRDRLGSRNERDRHLFAERGRAGAAEAPGDVLLSFTNGPSSANARRARLRRRAVWRPSCSSRRCCARPVLRASAEHCASTRRAPFHLACLSYR